MKSNKAQTIRLSPEELAIMAAALEHSSARIGGVGFRSLQTKIEGAVALAKAARGESLAPPSDPTADMFEEGINTGDTR